MIVRGAGDHLTIGQRIAFYRQRRGLTQAVLAGMVGRSEDWLSKIERGDRAIRRIDLIGALARELRVTVGDVLGYPVLAEDDEHHDDIPAIRDALMSSRQLSRVLYEPPSDTGPDPCQAARYVEHAWGDFQRGRVGRVVQALPGLIRTAQQLELADGNRRLCWAVSARTHHLAVTTLSKLGESDLAWIAAERAMRAADQSDDPLVIASATRAGTHALMAVGRYADALDLSQTAAGWLAGRIDDGDPAALSLTGMLHLRGATAAARANDRPAAAELLNRAAAAAEQFGEDANYWQTGFGPTNVRLHQMAASLDMGDVSFVVDKGPAIDTSQLPIERQVAHSIDLARAFSYAGLDDGALQQLLGAEQMAPTLVRQSAAVREIVKTVRRHSPVTIGRSPGILGLAERCRAIG